MTAIFSVVGRVFMWERILGKATALIKHFAAADNRIPKSKSGRIPPADPTSAAHNDGFAEPAECKNARYTNTLQFPDTAQDQQIVCRHTLAQRCNLHPLKYAPATVFRAAHRAGSFFIQCHCLRIHRVCGRGHTF